MAVTPFLKLQKPPFDTIPWDQAVNGNMDTIDAFIARYMAVPNYVGAWMNSVNYISGQNVLDIANATIYQCLVTHTSSAMPATFAQDRTTYPTYWAATTNVITGGAGNTVLTIAEATPLAAKAGDLWWDSLGGQLYVMYNDGNSMQWVIANNQSGMVGEAPNDGSVYGRRMSAWTPISQGNVGRNLIHNSMFNIAQRGVGPFTANGVYTLDRYKNGFTGGTLSQTQFAIADADRAAIGDEAAEYAFQSVCTGTAGAGDYAQAATHCIEDVKRLSGKTVTLSFWAKATAGTPKVGIEFFQSFGTGGSPSATVTGIGSQGITLSTTWTRYSATIAIPSAAGKAFGITINTDYTALTFWQSSGATLNVRAGSIGVQSYTLQLWGVQLEITQPGQTQPTPLEKPDPELQLRQCQRFYALGILVGVGYTTAGASFNVPFSLPVTMRATPSLVANNLGCANITTPSLSMSNARDGNSTGSATATGPVTFYMSYTASADL